MDPFYSRCAHISAERKNRVTGKIEHGFVPQQEILERAEKMVYFSRKQNLAKINKPAQTK